MGYKPFHWFHNSPRLAYHPHLVLKNTTMEGLTKTCSSYISPWEKNKTTTTSTMQTNKNSTTNNISGSTRMLHFLKPYLVAQGWLRTGVDFHRLVWLEEQQHRCCKKPSSCSYGVTNHSITSCIGVFRSVRQLCNVFLFFSSLLKIYFQLKLIRVILLTKNMVVITDHWLSQTAD